MKKHTFYWQVRDLLYNLTQTAYTGTPPQFFVGENNDHSITITRYDDGNPTARLDLQANWDNVWVAYNGAELSIKVPNKALKATAPTVALIVAGLLDNSRNQFGHLNDGIKKAATGGTVNAGMNGYLTTY